MLGENSRRTYLNSGAKSHSFIRVDVLAGFLAVEVGFQHRLNLGDTGRTANQDNIIDIVFRFLGVLEHLLHGLKGLLELQGLSEGKLSGGHLQKTY